MKKIIALILIVMVLLVMLPVYADSPPRPPEAWQRDLGDGFVFHYTPNEFEGQGYLPTGLYQDGELIYTVDVSLWGAGQLFFSNDRMSFMQADWWVMLRGDYNRWRENPHGWAVRFFYRGEVVRYYEVFDLNTNPGSFIVSVSHIQWDYQRKRYHDIENNTLQVTTRNGRNITFDLSTGEIISNEQAFMTATLAYDATRYGISPILIDNKVTELQAYRVEGENYFRLRDIAYILNGTSAQFSIDWDGESNAIMLTSGQPYTPIGGELGEISEEDAIAVFATATIFFDGESVYLGAYNINGNHYIKLRQFIGLLGYRVSNRGFSNIGSVQYIDLSVNFRWRNIRPDDESMVCRLFGVMEGTGLWILQAER